MHRGPRGEEGFSLVEILVALTILGVVVVTFVSVMASMTLATEHHRGQGATDAVLRDFGEEVKEKALTATTYTQCPQAADLTPVFSVAGYTTVLSDVEYWIPTSVADPLTGTWSDDPDDCTDFFALCGTCDPGLQRAKLTVTATLPEFRGGKTDTVILLRRGNTT